MTDLNDPTNIVCLINRLSQKFTIFVKPKKKDEEAQPFSCTLTPIGSSLADDEIDGFGSTAIQAIVSAYLEGVKINKIPQLV